MHLLFFGPAHSSFADFARFAGVLGLGTAAVGSMTEPRTVAGGQLRLGWVRESIAGPS